MLEQKLVVNALKMAKTVINENPENTVKIIETIGVLNFLIENIEDDEFIMALMIVSTDLMEYMCTK